MHDPGGELPNGFVERHPKPLCQLVKHRKLCLEVFDPLIVIEKTLTLILHRPLLFGNDIFQLLNSEGTGLFWLI